MAQLTCENVILGYEKTAVTGCINLSLNKGDYLCIIGDNGSGKSTLMKGILGLRKPMEGKITFGDGLKQNEIGYMPQHQRFLFFICRDICGDSTETFPSFI